MSTAERLRAKLRALLAKTVANGCTEEEAASAAEKARRLMAEHGIAEHDLAMGEARTDRQPAPPAWHKVVLAAVSVCTNTAVLIEEHRGGSADYVFVGVEPGPEIAVYLREVALRAVETGIGAFRQTPAVAGQRLWLFGERAVADFTEAFAGRLADRLREIFASERNEAHVARALARRDALCPGGQLVHGGRHRMRDAAAFAAGTAAADAVALHHGVRTAPRAAQRLGRGA